jgi:hypothetical protein
MHSPQTVPQLLFEPCRDGKPAARQRADHHPVRGIQLVDNPASDMTQPPRHPVSLHGRPDRLPNYQPNSRTRLGLRIVRPSRVNHDVGLHRAHAVFHRGTEVGRPFHSITSGEHRRRCSGPVSGGQRPAALATPVVHDRPAGTGAHAQPETVHTRPTPIVRLEGPLPLSHGNLSSLGMAFRASAQPVKSRTGWSECPLVSSFVSLANRRVPHDIPGWLGTRPPDLPRFAAVSPTFGRLFEGTDATSRGQTTLQQRPQLYSRHSRHVV